MTEIIIRNAIPTRAGNISLVWDAARNDNSNAVVINGNNYYSWSDYNYSGNQQLVGQTVVAENYASNIFNRPYISFNYNELYVTPVGNVFYYGPATQRFQNVFIICQVANNGQFGHILSFGNSIKNGSTFENTQPMYWSGVSLSLFHDITGNHTYIFCRVGLNYKRIKTNNFNFDTLYCFSIENVDTFGQDVVFKWDNHILCTIPNITNGVDGYTTANCNMVSNTARYVQIGAGKIADFNLPFNGVLQTEQNGVLRCFAIGVGKITDDLMTMIYSRYNYEHLPLNITQTDTYVIDGTLGTIFGTTTNFSGNMQIL
jgi:hypothetical protein